MKRLLVCSLLLMGVVLPGTAGAHPHIFIENSVRVMFDGAGMTGLAVRWIFDEMFSATMIEEFDGNKDGTFSTAEVEALRKGAFSNLENYHYFTYISTAAKTYEITRVENFHAVIKNHKIIYTFFVPCKIQASSKPAKVTIAVYDETYYSDIALTTYTCDHTAAPGIVSSSIKEIENAGKSYYFGQIAPVELIVTFKR